jgi:hypothetical protein
MKKLKIFFIVAVLFIYLSSFLSVSNATTNIDITNSVSYLYVGSVLYVGGGGYTVINNGNVSGYGGGSVSIHIYNSSYDKTFSNSSVSLKYYGTGWVFYINVIPAGTYYIDITASNLWFNQGGFLFNGHFFGSISVPNGGTGSVNNLTPSVSLTYNNDFSVSGGYGTASFKLTASNFKVSSIDMVQWTAGNSYKMQIYNWTASKIDDFNYTITVKFVNVSDGSYSIDMWAGGQTTSDNTSMSMKASSIFNISGTSTITAGTLLIVSPSELVHIDLPAAGSTVSDEVINFVLEYGGDAIKDFGSDGQFIVKVIKVKAGDSSKILQSNFISNTAWVYNSTTNISTATFSYKWLNASDISDYDIIFGAFLQNPAKMQSIYSQNTVEVVLGSPSSSSGNVLIDFLSHLWEEFKKWFVDVMQYLFVPSASQMQAIGLTNGGLSDEMKSYLPFLDLSSYASNKILFVKLSNFNSKYSDMYIDFSNSSLDGLFTFSKIAIDSILSILLMLLVYEVLK